MRNPIRRRRPGDEPRRIDWGIVLLLILTVEVTAALVTVVVILINTTN